MQVAKFILLGLILMCLIDVVLNSSLMTGSLRVKTTKLGVLCTYSIHPYFFLQLKMVYVVKISKMFSGSTVREES